MSGRFLEAARAVDRLADTCGTEAELPELMRCLQYREEMQIAATIHAVSRVSDRRDAQRERLALREGGDDFGQVEASIPKNLFFGLLKQKNFGYDGFTSDEGMRDFSKAYPQFMCRTVSGKTTVGFGGSRGRAPRRGRVNFRGANFGGMQFAE